MATLERRFAEAAGPAASGPAETHPILNLYSPTFAIPLDPEASVTLLLGRDPPLLAPGDEPAEINID